MSDSKRRTVQKRRRLYCTISAAVLVPILIWAIVCRNERANAEELKAAKQMLTEVHEEWRAYMDSYDKPDYPRRLSDLLSTEQITESKLKEWSEKVQLEPFRPINGHVSTVVVARTRWRDGWLCITYGGEIEMLSEQDLEKRRRWGRRY